MADESKMPLFRVRACGVVGIVAACLMFLSDCVIMDSSASGAQFQYVALDRLADSPNWRLTLGGITGPIAACCFVVGFGHVYLALRPGGKYLAMPCAAGLAAGYIVLGAWHAAGPFLAYVIRLLPGDAHLTEHESWSYMMNLGLAGFIPMATSLLVLPLLILVRPTMYPRWFVLFTPGMIYLGTFSFTYLPGPVGGYLVMGSGSLSFMMFFLFSTVLLWHGGNRRQSFEES